MELYCYEKYKGYDLFVKLNIIDRESLYCGEAFSSQNTDDLNDVIYFDGNNGDFVIDNLMMLIDQKLNEEA